MNAHSVGAPGYREYIESDAWKAKRTEALKRAVRRDAWRSGPACEVCGKRGTRHKKSRSDLDSTERRFRVDDSKGLQVHHLHYRSLGDEDVDDLIVLCTDELYYFDYDRSYEAWLRRTSTCTPEEREALSREMPRLPKRVGCHERAHDDLTFRHEVERIAGARRAA